MKKALSFVLCMLLMFGTLVVAFLPVEVHAALTVPEALTHEPEINGTKVTMIGELTKNGGTDITEYGFSYQINGSSTQTKRYTGALIRVKKLLTQSHWTRVIMVIIIFMPKILREKVLFQV